MSSAVGDLPGSRDMGLEQKRGKAEQNGILTVREGEREIKSEHGRPGGEGGEGLDRRMSEISLHATEEEEEDDDEEEDGKGAKGLDLGPQVSIKDQLEKDKVWLRFLSS